jgi:hypothetical protein
MNCIDIQEKIIDLLIGELSAEDRYLVQQHMESCPLCRDDFHFLSECLQICSLEESETCECQFQETYWNEFVVSVHERITHEKIEKRFPFHIIIPIAASGIFAIILSYYIFLKPKPQETVQERLPGYEPDTYEEVQDFSPEETEEFLKLINQKYYDK